MQIVDILNYLDITNHFKQTLFAENQCNLRIASLHIGAGSG